MLLDASGTPIPLTPLPEPAAPPPVDHPFAHLKPLANPTLATELRGLADLVDQGIIFDVTLVALGKDVKAPEPISIGRHAFIAHAPIIIGELAVLQARIASAVVDARTPKPTLANGEVLDQGAAA